MKAVTGDVRYTDILKYDGYKEANNMCELLDRLINERIEKERAIIKEKDEQLTQKEVQLIQKNEQLTQKEVPLIQKDEQLTEKDAIIEELRKQLAVYQNQ